MSDLSGRQLKALQALLEYPTVRASAEAVQLSERQLYRYMDSPAFQQELRKQEGLILDTTVRRLTALSVKAVQALEDILTFPTQQGAGVRLRASAVVLDTILKLRELITLEGRISRLEGLIHEQNKS